jgi:hypothetical protein
MQTDAGVLHLRVAREAGGSGKCFQFGAREPRPEMLCTGGHTDGDPRKSFELEVNKKSGVRHKRDFKRDLYVMPD